MIATLVGIGLVSWYVRMPPHDVSQNRPAQTLLRRYLSLQCKVDLGLGVEQGALKSSKQ